MQDDDQFWSGKGGGNVQGSKGPHPDARRNIEVATAFMAKKVMLSGMDMRWSDSSGIEKVALFISWIPQQQEYGNKWSQVISTHQPHLSFMYDLEESYSLIVKKANNSIERKRHKQVDLPYASAC